MDTGGDPLKEPAQEYPQTHDDVTMTSSTVLPKTVLTVAVVSARFTCNL
jgi:hypothetical protein